MSSIFKLFTSLSHLWSFISLLVLFSTFLINQVSGVNGGGDQPEFAVDLKVTNFDAVLNHTPAVYAIVEFSAHWCPACRNYKPQYEKVAKLFNGANAVHPGIILMTRVDCANKINTKLCDLFSVTHYPSLYWGPPFKFVGGGWDGKNKKNEIRSIEDGRTADHLLKWINTQLGSSYNLEDEKYENDQLLQSNVSDPGQVAEAQLLLRGVDGGGDQPDFVVDLNVTNFDAVLNHTPAIYAIVQFYAHWSPASRKYKPQYEKVASLFNGADAVHPGILLMTRVDCAIKVNTNLCDKFSANHYPMFFWGPSSSFVGGSWGINSENSEIHRINNGRTAERMLKWINTQLESSFRFEDEKYQGNNEA